MAKEKFGVNGCGHLDVPARMTVNGNCSSSSPPSNAFTSKQLPVPPSSANASANINGIPLPTVNNSFKPKSFSEAVSNSAGGIHEQARFVVASPDNYEVAKDGKCSPTHFSLIPNSEMVAEITKEKCRLKDTAIFFAAVEVEKCPPRKFMDDWFHNFWNTKLGFHISFCTQIQKGLFVIFFANHDAQQEVLKKKYWNVGSTSFCALAWTPKAIHEEFLALSMPRWILVKNLLPFLWHFLT